jgi:WD repeat-containing protein 70
MFSDISSIAVTKDGQTIVTRACDNTMKVWDLRKIKEPLAAFTDLQCHYPEADVIFSPDESLICTGTSALNQGEAGSVVFVDRKSLSVVKRLTVSQGSVISLLWHDKINQLICGSSDGNTHVLFDPALSQKGIMYAVKKAPRSKGALDWEPTDIDRPILTPHALPEFKDAPSTKRQREKAAKDPILSRRPEQPQIGHGSKGRMGTSLAADMMKKFVAIDKDVKETSRDPREALLAYADIAEKDPIFFKVYKENPAPLNYELSKQMQQEEEAKQSDQAALHGTGFTKSTK